MVGFCHGGNVLGNHDDDDDHHHHHHHAHDNHNHNNDGVAFFETLKGSDQ